jgi:hypothetical protein
MTSHYIDLLDGSFRVRDPSLTTAFELPTGGVASCNGQFVSASRETHSIATRTLVEPHTSTRAIDTLRAFQSHGCRAHVWSARAAVDRVAGSTA